LVGRQHESESGAISGHGQIQITHGRDHDSTLANLTDIRGI
jgi:hypothetical protein